MVTSLVAHAYAVLTSYAPFGGYPPFVAAAVALAIILSGLVWLESWPGCSSWLFMAANLAGIVAGLGAYAANYAVYRGQYATLHHSLTIAATGLLVVGATALARRQIRSRWGPSAALTAIGAALLVTRGGLVADAEGYFFEYSELGRLLPADVQQGYLPLSGERLMAATRPDNDAPRRFEAFSQLPTLPSEFKLEDYNVLLVSSEATRYDSTSLANDRLGTTPHLKAMARRAFVATAAYSPSSGTLHSMSSLLTMKYPAAIALTTWMRPWDGQLATAETTIAEVFSAAGYSTWWIGHNYRQVFGRAILGLDQGFQSVQLVPENTDADARLVDDEIASLAIARLTQASRSAPGGRDERQRFFGWIFFGSPHAPYVEHGFSEMAAATKKDRYLQEVRNVDRQLGRLFSAVERLGLLDDTVVIYLSDHGEEFHEHGGEYHKTTVYTESLHVPLAVWAPGLGPSTASLPTSTLYVFPWLLSKSGRTELSKPANMALTTYIGPMLRETNGAVLSELLGHDRIKSTLIYPGKKLNYDYRSGLFELYLTDADRAEQKDVFRGSETRLLVQRFAGYAAQREATLRHRFLPNKQTPELVP